MKVMILPVKIETHRTLNTEVQIRKTFVCKIVIISNLSVNTYVFGAQKKCLHKMV